MRDPQGMKIFQPQKYSVHHLFDRLQAVKFCGFASNGLWHNLEVIDGVGQEICHDEQILFFLRGRSRLFLFTILIVLHSEKLVFHLDDIAA